MKKRSPALVLIFSCLSCGIYAIYWWIVVGNELKAKGADIPHWIFLFLPILGLIYMWKFCAGVEKATNNAISGVTSFILTFLLSVIGMAVIQSKLNAVA